MWTIETISDNHSIARDGLRRIILRNGLAMCSNFAEDAPREGGSTDKTASGNWEKIWVAAKMHTAPIKKVRNTITPKYGKYHVHW